VVYGNGIYGVTKHAVVALSESVYGQLQMARAKIGVSVLCPGFVKTNIMNSARNLPPELAAKRMPSAADIERRANDARNLEHQGMEPSEVADEVIAAVREQRFYILPMREDFKQGVSSIVRRRAEDIVAEGSPRAGRPPGGS
jgi:short-subunit dehydrogenase